MTAGAAAAEIPNPKHQIPRKLQTPIIKGETVCVIGFGFEVSSFGICLGFGVWFLGFPASLDLEFGISSFAGKDCEG
jgi:hypothetical protein